MRHRMERRKQQTENNQNRNRQHDGQPLHGACLVLELAAPFDEIPGRQRQTGMDRLLRRFDEAAQIGSADIRLYYDAPLRVLARHDLRTALRMNRRDLIQAHPLASGSLQHQAA